MVSEGIHFLFPAYVAFFSSKVKILDFGFLEILRFVLQFFSSSWDFGFCEFFMFFSSSIIIYN